MIKKKNVSDKILGRDPAGLLVTVKDEAVLSGLIAVIEKSAKIRTMKIRGKKISFELSEAGSVKELIRNLSKIRGVSKVEDVTSFAETYGKRVIIVGGGAQVAEAAKGAIIEADRHNLRGEKISVDTIPLVGEENLEHAVQAVRRLDRVGALVLAGSIMGGNITKEVRKAKNAGIFVVSLKMFGSVTKEADLVITDPVQAGVLAVMAIADTAAFKIEKVKGREI